MMMAMVLIFSMVACSPKAGNPVETPAETGVETKVEAETPKEKYTIAVAWKSIDASTQTRMDYLKNYLGPQIGVDFIFSEVISDIDSLLTFVENSYASGARAILSTVTDGTEALAARANELGMYTAVVSSTPYESVSEIPTYMGITGIDITRVADAYGEILNQQFSSEEPANFIVVTGGSAMGVASHREAAKSMLLTLQEKYKLTYEKSIEELVALKATSDVATGNQEVKITIVPGFPNMDGYVSGVSGLLQTGEYDAIISVFPTAEVFATAIDEVEKSLGKNIKMICQANFGENTKHAFSTLDSTGNPTLDGAVMYAGTVNDAYGIVMLYNGLSGHADLMKPDGKAIVFAPGPLVCATAEDYARLEQLDTKDDMYIYSADEVKSMLKAYNPDATFESIMEYAEKFSAEDILERRGLN